MADISEQYCSAYLVKSMSYVRVSIGVWWSIMEAEGLLDLPLSLPRV